MDENTSYIIWSPLKRCFRKHFLLWLGNVLWNVTVYTASWTPAVYQSSIIWHRKKVEKWDPAHTCLFISKGRIFTPSWERFRTWLVYAIEAWSAHEHSACALACMCDVRSMQARGEGRVALSTNYSFVRLNSLFHPTTNFEQNARSTYSPLPCTALKPTCDSNSRYCVLKTGQQP